MFVDENGWIRKLKNNVKVAWSKDRHTKNDFLPQYVSDYRSFCWFAHFNSGPIQLPFLQDCFFFELSISAKESNLIQV